MARKKSKCGGTKSNRYSAAASLKKLQKGNERYLGHDPINYPTAEERSDFENGQEEVEVWWDQK